MPHPTFSDWLHHELDKKLASLSSDQARYRHLILMGNQWSLKEARFLHFREQPFCEPHPKHGDMTARDFEILLADIERRKELLELARTLA